jgi:MarR family transcriptional regulator, 2-MHQ and catechol-resistance regulon repressor
VDLTDGGKAFIEEIFARHEVDLEKVTAELNEEERNRMYEGLKKIGLAAKAAMAESKEAKQEASA